jgi:hypothetical protein
MQAMVTNAWSVSFSISYRMAIAQYYLSQLIRRSTRLLIRTVVA